MAAVKTSLASAFLIVLLALPSASAADPEDRGAALFGLCATCHGRAGEGNRIALAPAIAGMREWHLVAQLRKFRSGQRGTHFDDISGMRMRPMSLVLRTDADVEAVARHVAALDPVRPPDHVEGGDPARGEALYGPCSGCHGLRGEGVEATSGSPLVNLDDWYLLEQLRKFRSGARGSNPDDPMAVMMRPMAMLLDDQGMKDVVAFISTLSAESGK